MRNSGAVQGTGHRSYMIPLCWIVYARPRPQLLLPGFAREHQEKLKAATVLVAGIGGLGGTAALYLAVAGVGRLVLAHAGKLTTAQYLELAHRIEGEVGGIVANCKLEPKADAMLHLVIADLGAGTDAMAGKSATLRPELGLVKVAQAVNAYGSHFEHPGFAPIRTGH